MDTAKLFFELAALAFLLLFVLNGVIARAVLPSKLMDRLHRRKWSGADLAIAVAPGVVLPVVGLFALQLYFWFPFGALLLAMLVSGLMVWGLGKIRPQMSLLRKSAWVFLLYLAGGIALWWWPAVRAAPVPWTNPRQLLGMFLALLVLALYCAGALLIVAGATAYFAVAGEIARAVLLPPAAERAVASGMTASQRTAPWSAIATDIARALFLPPPSPRPQPQEVQIATSLIWAALAFGPLKLALDFRFYLSKGLALTLIGSAFAIGLVVFLIVRISTGRNWARIAFLVLFILGLPLFLLTGPGEFARSRFVFLLGVAQIGLQIGALWLLLQKRAVAYFHT